MRRHAVLWREINKRKFLLTIYDFLAIIEVQSRIQNIRRHFIIARPKGSKNKTKVLDGVDYAAQIAEKNAAAKSIAEEIASIGSNIAALNAERKAKDAELKKLNKEIMKLEKKKADADEKIAAELNRKKAEDIVANALANGMTVEDIAELLK